MSPARIQQSEHDKLEQISALSISLLDLKKKQSDLNQEKAVELKSKCLRVKQMRLEHYKQMSQELDEKERELCRKTNQLMDDLVAICDDSPFHKALIKILGNLKGLLYFE